MSQNVRRWLNGDTRSTSLVRVSVSPGVERLYPVELAPAVEWLAKQLLPSVEPLDRMPYSAFFEGIIDQFCTRFQSTVPELLKHYEIEDVGKRGSREAIWRFALRLRKDGVLGLSGSTRPRRAVPLRVDTTDRDVLESHLPAHHKQLERLPYTNKFEAVFRFFNADRTRRQMKTVDRSEMWQIIEAYRKVRPRFDGSKRQLPSLFELAVE